MEDRRAKIEDGIDFQSSIFDFPTRIFYPYNEGMIMFRRLAPVATPISFKELAQCGGKLFSASNGVHNFEQRLSKELGTKHALVLSSGRAGLTVILKMLAQKKGKNEVIIPAYSCPSVAASVVKAGLKVVLCDLENEGFGFDSTQLKAIIGSDTLAIICVHLYGCMIPIEPVLQMAQDKGIDVIEDRSQAAETVHTGHGVPLKGTIAFYSLGRGKNITTGGGGIITTDNLEYTQKMYRMINNGHNGGFFHSLSLFLKLAAYALFINPLLYFIPQHLPFLRLGETIYSTDFQISGLSPVQSRLGMAMLEKLDQLNQSRREKALFYRDNLKGIKGVSLFADTEQNIYLRFPLLVEDEKKREMIYQEARRKGLGVSKSYPEPLNRIKELMPHLKVGAYGHTPLRTYPNAQKVAKRILTLPTHHWVREKDMLGIIEIIERHCLVRSMDSVKSFMKDMCKKGLVI